MITADFKEARILTEDEHGNFHYVYLDERFPISKMGELGEFLLANIQEDRKQHELDLSSYDSPEQNLHNFNASETMRKIEQGRY